MTAIINVATECACGEAMCLYHYSQLDPGRQARERRRAGVHEPYVGRGR
jgi:hypothetical protein